VGVFCNYVCVLLFLLCGLGYNLLVPLKADQLVEIIVTGFCSSPTDLLQSLAVVLQQQPSPGGYCFYWLGLFEPFCHLKQLCAAPGKARLVYDSFGIIDDYHCLMLPVCVCILLPFSLWFVGVCKSHP
jgi:hypothetical protein